jgi:hypothetical protein
MSVFVSKYQLLRLTSRNQRGLLRPTLAIAGLLLVPSVPFLSGAARAQSTIFAQDSTLTASGPTIIASRVPVQTGSKISYWDITMTIAVVNGVPSATTTKSVVSPLLLTDHFQAGNYTGPSVDTKFLATVSGPGVGPAGTTVWSFNAASGANGAIYPTTATWYAGLIANNPLASRITQAKITYSGLSYGLTGDNAFGGENSFFANGCLIGASQNGKSLTLLSFSVSGCSSDQSTPTAMITYTLNSP